MLQRKQSIFLFFSLLILGALFFINLGTFANKDGIFELHFYGLIDATNPDTSITVISVWSLAIMIILPLVLCFLSIFMYRHRPAQMRVCGINIGLQIGLTALLIFLSYNMSKTLETPWHFHFSAILPIISAVFTYIAYRFIYADELLIRSLNRLR